MHASFSASLRVERCSLVTSVVCALAIACSSGDASSPGSAGQPSASGGSSGSSSAGASGSPTSTTGGGAAGSTMVSGAGGSVGGSPAAAGSGPAGSGGSGTAGISGSSGAGGGAGSAAGGVAGAASGQMKLFDGTSLDGWTEYPPGNWKVVDGAMKATGKGRGFIATNAQYTHYRLLFSLKPGGTGGHAPCILQFCTQPPPTLDACGGIQFQPPKGGTWDYRPGHNNAGNGLFTHVGQPGAPDADGFYHCEVIANAMTGEAKLACGGKEVVRFKDATAGKKGPWAIQTHNADFSDEYKDVSVEENISSDEFVTVK